jgi:hypothetical protein
MICWSLVSRICRRGRSRIWSPRAERADRSAAEAASASISTSLSARCLWALAEVDQLVEALVLFGIGGSGLLGRRSRIARASASSLRYASNSRVASSDVFIGVLLCLECPALAWWPRWWPLRAPGEAPRCGAVRMVTRRKRAAPASGPACRRPRVDHGRVGSGVDSRDEQILLLGRQLGVGLAEDRERASIASGSTSSSSASAGRRRRGGEGREVDEADLALPCRRASLLDVTHRTLPAVRERLVVHSSSTDPKRTDMPADVAAGDGVADRPAPLVVGEVGEDPEPAASSDRVIVPAVVRPSGRVIMLCW